MANILELAGLGGAVTLFTQQILDSAAESKRDELTSKEIWSTAFLIGAGAIVSWQEKSPFPVLLMIALAVVFFVAQEKTHTQSTQYAPTNVIKGPWMAAS